MPYSLVMGIEGIHEPCRYNSTKDEKKRDGAKVVNRSPKSSFRIRSFPQLLPLFFHLQQQYKAIRALEAWSVRRPRKPRAVRQPHTNSATRHLHRQLRYGVCGVVVYLPLRHRPIGPAVTGIELS